MIRNTSTTAPNPQDMMSRKLRLNVEDCRLRLATNHGSTVMKRTSTPPAHSLSAALTATRPATD
ncbi:MAG: Uncharacterised protein [Halieaceae bacterium]|nr:MAG: Uncharacterised protein [Halieaceae bacterium]